MSYSFNILRDKTECFAKVWTDGQMDGWADGRTDGRMEFYPTPPQRFGFKQPALGKEHEGTHPGTS